MSALEGAERRVEAVRANAVRAAVAGHITWAEANHLVDTAYAREKRRIDTPGEYIADNGIWLTAGEVIDHLEKFPRDMPVTILQPDGGGWLNTPGMSDPRESDEPSVMFYTSDDFDTRQW